uniref:Uncharacterized protein n=1 Tax=Siphoviridae sp. ctHip2 TaxID=2827830 RepID=A0A8S5RX08_9CAUD|nr:MAG TPA: hypothetical protein [Siphoviridae sp. ctHip2]
MGLLFLPSLLDLVYTSKRKTKKTNKKSYLR